METKKKEKQILQINQIATAIGRINVYNYYWRQIQQQKI